MQITLKDLCYSYEDAAGLALAGVSACFDTGWTGIVGANGSGKSTLLRVVCGQLASFGGTVVPVPGRGLTQGFVYCQQESEHPPAGAEDFACDYSRNAQLARSRLGVADDWLWRFDTLSHGERKRLQLAVALAAHPPLLALDEPTNHVDAATRAVVLEALAAYDGVGLVVSHDRELLDALAYQCLFLREGTGVLHPGGYSEGRAQEQLELESAVRARRNAKHELSRLKAEQDKRAHEAARADARRSKRTIDPKDKSAKAQIDLAIYTGQDGKAGKRSASMDTRVRSAEAKLAQAFVPKQYEGAFWLNTQPARRKVLVELKPGLVPWGALDGSRAGEGSWVSEGLQTGEGAGSRADEDADAGTTNAGPQAGEGAGGGVPIPPLLVENTAHIGLEGPNGAGKSTVLRWLMAHLATDIQTLYLPQELSRAEAARELAALRALDTARRGQVLSLVARLGSNPNRLLSGEALSPGELRKLLLARGILDAPQLIVMDEPTNHLDVQSVEALEEVLAACPCALVLVSHDALFLNACTTTRWVFDGRGVRVCW